jgi:cytochrome oxidase assembly protein ShyY1
VLETLRQPRYAALSAVMVVVALACIAAGTWQIARFEQKVHENDALRANARHTPVAVSAVLPMVGTAPAPARDDVELRPVTATGSYDAAAQTLVRSRTINDRTGFLVLTPFRTGSATLLVIRGFLPQPASGDVPVAPVPPAGSLTITASAHGPETRDDAAAQLTDAQVESINPVQQAARLGGPIYDGYAALEAGQPGTRGLTAIPPPDLSNPAGGALEPQHFAYIIQWYLFALLALAAPVVMARAETRQQPTGEIDDDVAAVERSPAEVRAAKLADRYGHAR